jgi:hypothetical protein
VSFGATFTPMGGGGETVISELRSVTEAKTGPVIGSAAGLPAGVLHLTWGGDSQNKWRGKLALQYTVATVASVVIT